MPVAGAAPVNNIEEATLLLEDDKELMTRMIAGHHARGAGMFPDSATLLNWVGEHRTAVTQGTHGWWTRANTDVHMGIGVYEWPDGQSPYAPAQQLPLACDNDAQTSEPPGATVYLDDGRRLSWPWDHGALQYDEAPFFSATPRCDQCGTWVMRPTVEGMPHATVDEHAGSCITCRRLTHPMLEAQGYGR